ncbi:GNAT family N-acetyltransferase [Thermodesulfobacteriota bacterium]
MVTKTINTIKEIDRTLWNNTLRGAYFSYEWFEYIEEIFAAEYRPFYLLCFDGSHLKAILPAFAPNSYDNIYTRLLLGRAKPILDKLKLFRGTPLLCIAPEAGGRGYFTDQRVDHNVIGELLQAGDKIVEQEKFTGMVFPFVLDEQHREITLLESMGYQKIFLNKAGVFYNRFTNFEEYRSTIPKKMRNLIKREISRFNEAGCTLEVLERPADQVRLLYRLAYNIQKKHQTTNIRSEEKQMQTVYAKLARYLTCYVVKKDDQTIGAISLLEKDEVIATYGFGLEYEQTIKNRTYFYLLYYHTIMEMIKRDITSINFNAMAYKIKERRGCKLIPQYMLIKPRKGKRLMCVWKHCLNYQYQKKFKQNYLAQK